MRYGAFIVFAFLIVASNIKAQNKDLNRLEKSELKMTLPSIYFKHNSTEYTSMPYQVDSCFQYIARHIKDINDLVIWRDSFETEKLSAQRIRKLKAELSKRKVTGIHIQSMKEKQKISRLTINTSGDSVQIKYLLSLNSVFEVAKTRQIKKRKKDHRTQNFLWCPFCWRHPTRGVPWRIFPRDRAQEGNPKQSEKKHGRHLVWTGWRTGFHWSDPR